MVRASVNAGEMTPSRDSALRITYNLLIIGTGVSAILSSFQSNDVTWNIWANVAVIGFAAMTIALLLALQVFQKRMSWWLVFLMVLFSAFIVVAGLEVAGWWTGIDSQSVLLALACVALVLPFVNLEAYLKVRQEQSPMAQNFAMADSPGQPL